MASLGDKLFMHDPAWLDPDGRSWERREGRTCGTRAALAPRSMVSTAVATCPHRPTPATHGPPTAKVSQPRARARYKDHEFTISRCNRRPAMLPYSAHRGQLRREGRASCCARSTTTQSGSVRTVLRLASVPSPCRPACSGIRQEEQANILGDPPNELYESYLTLT